jgi:hypothetical protein
VENGSARFREADVARLKLVPSPRLRDVCPGGPTWQVAPMVAKEGALIAVPEAGEGVD